jgi:hypothetical protein
MKPSLLEVFWATPGTRPSLSNREWETLLGQSRQASVLARLAAHHLDQGWLAEAPAGPRPHLEGALRLADRQQHEVHWEVDCISRALKTLDVPFVLLKGAAYLMADLPPASGRLFSDIDLLVPRENIEAVESALLAAGWISDERDPYNQRYYREWMHESPPLRHVQRNTYIDLHHTITPPTSRFHVDGAKLLNKIVPLPGYSAIFVLAPVDMVLHSAVHLFTEGEFGHGLRDLLDLNDLVDHFSSDADFWNQLIGRSSELGLRIPLFHALFHLQRLFGTSPPQNLQKAVEQLGPNWVARQLMAWMLGLAIRPMHPTANMRWTGLARWLLYVRSHVLRMPVRLVVPHLARKAWMARFPKESV